LRNFSQVGLQLIFNSGVQHDGLAGVIRC